MKRHAGRGALVLLALLFASSGALRIGDGIGSALAESAKAQGNADEKGASMGGTMELSAEGGVPEAKPECPAPPEELVAALTAREERLLVQEAAVADREAALALADEAIKVRLEELRAAEEELRATLALADGAAEADISRLVAVYETMKPKDAARLFDAMEADFAAGFLGRMRPDAAAAVMAGMTPEKAYAVSAILAGQNAAVPKE
jgi:flagellar motility protein MotE (MotC chaperone)